VSLFPSVVLVLAVTVFAATLGIAGVLRPVLRTLARMPPRARAGGVLLVLGAPWIVGMVLTAVALGHCWIDRVRGLQDDCVRCGFCLFQSAGGSRWGWLIALAALSPVGFAVTRLAGGMLRARRASVALRGISERLGDNMHLIPGRAAFVIGWLSPSVFIGEELRRTLAPASMAAITAHEDGHRKHRDTFARMLGRLLSAVHLPRAALQLVASLDLALEQACDELASATVQDRLVVAQALIDVARIQDTQPDGRDCQCVPATLAARIDALCSDAAPAIARPRLAMVGALFAFGVAAGLAGGHQLHRAAEALVRFVT